MWTLVIGWLFLQSWLEFHFGNIIWAQLLLLYSIWPTSGAWPSFAFHLAPLTGLIHSCHRTVPWYFFIHHMSFKWGASSTCSGSRQVEEVCGEPKGVLNKLCDWVWHSPKLQKRANIVMSSKTAHSIGTASAAEVGKMKYSCFFL
jgi:hypothetical protein